jgi:hypothetical protein
MLKRNVLEEKRGGILSCLRVFFLLFHVELLLIQIGTCMSVNLVIALKYNKSEEEKR